MLREPARALTAREPMGLSLRHMSHWVAGNDILSSFHHQELCQLKVCVLCSSENKHIIQSPPAIELRSTCTYLEF